ncbi:MAG: 4-hydroxybenzoate octaprenyltransferase [Gammaproteobacteria bacterium]|jgi:4-hydroxybenzoate polyprenyltransferase|nr:4-hydroxybenzoate octaprenyltransferase [Gammaproteobacteria bacterium]MBT7308018.1 4-hydroxybenzoate octaprenyltransferase [Gammaproteobacteria bacterium]
MLLKWGAYLRLMRLDRPIGILLLLWPTLWGLWIAAEGFPPWAVLLVFLLGVVLMRSAGCIINDYADREVDRHVRRTAERPITRGEVSPREALLLFGGMVLVAFLLVLTMNGLTILLSIGALLLAILYPFMKRYTQLPQLFLGAAFGWAIPMAFAAVTGAVPTAAWVLFLATLCWAVVYDTMYAMVDREDDLKVGIRSTAILFGKWDRLMIGLFQLLMGLLLVRVGIAFGLGEGYYLGLLAAAGLGGYHQWLIRKREPAMCFRAFLHNHWLGMVVFLGIALDPLF